MSLSRISANAAPKHNAEVNSKKTVVVIGKVTDDTR
jgi:ribosomal protein L18E